MVAYGRNIEGHNIEDKIHCSAPKLAETWLKSSLAICHYVKVQQLDLFVRHGDIKQTRRQNMAEIVFSWGVSEIKYIIFIENSDYPYENYNNYIKLSIVFHPMVIFLGNKDI